VASTATNIQVRGEAICLLRARRRADLNREPADGRSQEWVGDDTTIDGLEVRCAVTPV